MKVKFLLPLLAAMFISSVSMAQFHIGVKAGTNITKLDGISFKDKFSYGYSLGAFAEIGLGEKWGLQPELLFNQYSSKVDSNYRHVYQNVFNSDQSKVKLNYLSIPLLLSYNLIGKVVVLQAGPQFSILMDQSKTLLQNGGKAFSDGDFAMLGGVQFRLGSFRASGRYTVGLNNINDIDDKDKWKNQGFQVAVGLAF